MAVPGGTCVEGPYSQPDVKAEMRLSGMRLAGAGCGPERSIGRKLQKSPIFCKRRRQVI